MKKVLLPIVLLAILFAACKKKESTVSTAITTPTVVTTPSVTPTPISKYKTYGSIDEIYNALKLQPTVVNFDAAAGASFYGNGGTRYVIPPNCLQTATGATVTGSVRVEVTDYIKKGDMIFSGVLPVSDGQPLISGGENNVVVSQGGQKLFLKSNSTYQANVPQAGTIDTSMTRFRGTLTGNTQDNRVNWRESSALITNSVVIVPSIKVKDTLRLICDSFDFWNCDHFMSGSYTKPKFKVVLTVTGQTADLSDFRTYAIFDKLNGLMTLSGYTTAGYAVSNVPNLPIHFISYGLIDKHFYAGVVAATPAEGQTYTITLTETDPTEFKTTINGY
ncbi:MAG: hypothetical protein JWQ38_246 [Flavipsychrobacter sp.]|nr:hypothetical protein [Flavipsychrobacter sp.]